MSDKTKNEYFCRRCHAMVAGADINRESINNAAVCKSCAGHEYEKPFPRKRKPNTRKLRKRGPLDLKKAGLVAR